LTNRYTKTNSIAIRTLNNGTREASTVPRNTKVVVAEESVATVPLVEVDWNSAKFLMFADELLRSDEIEQAVGDTGRSQDERFEELAFGMAHDLQAPLRSIGTITELFLRRIPAQLDNESISMLKYVIDGVRRMKHLIRDMLELATVTTGVEMADVDPGAVAEMAVQNLRSAIAESGARITIDNLPPVHAHEGQLLRVFQNLIGNAIKYRGKSAPVIHISGSAKSGKCIFSVSDNGIGIDPKYHAKIFETFSRLHSEGQQEGNGVGLSIVKRIVEWHKGRIWLESEVGRGSVFYFSIPNEEAAKPPERQESSSVQPKLRAEAAV
jgi:two-component system, chemotaxis family, sensor kinase Cph1